MGIAYRPKESKPTTLSHAVYHFDNKECDKSSRQTVLRNKDEECPRKYMLLCQERRSEYLPSEEKVANSCYRYQAILGGLQKLGIWLL